MMIVPIVSYDQNYQQLLLHGEAKILLQGGKIDDITVLVAVVTEEDVPEEVPEPQEISCSCW